MAVSVPSNHREVQDFQFKQICRLRVFPGPDKEYAGSYQLVAPCSKYGLAFVGSRNAFQVISLPSIFDLEHPSGGGEITHYLRREIPLPASPTHIGVNCDQTLLAVVVRKDGCAHALIYSIPSFLSQSVSLVKEVRLSTNPILSVLELSWNPGVPSILASCLSDGSAGVYEFKATGVDINTLPPAAEATCFCWSPKGKQLVIGAMNGSLTQYKPELKAVKSFSPPAIFENPAAVVNVLWVSNFQFAAIYRDRNNANERPALVVVNAPKGGPVSYVNYEDICFSCGDLRKPQFYLLHQPSWNVLMVGSANSMEVGVLGLAEDQLSWEQWIQEDAARAELPLTANKEETYPLGLAFDTSTQHVLPLGENQTIPPMPVLMLVSHHGVMCLFYAINLRPQASLLCSPPTRLPDESGLALFTTGPKDPPAGSLSPAPAAAVHAGGDAEGKVRPKTPPPLAAQTKAATTFSSWATPTSAVSDEYRMTTRVNLTDKFDHFSTAQSANSGAANLFKTPADAAKPAFSFFSGGLATSTPVSMPGGLLSLPAQTSTGFKSFGSGTSFSLSPMMKLAPAQQPLQPAPQQLVQPLAPPAPLQQPQLPLSHLQVPPQVMTPAVNAMKPPQMNLFSSSIPVSKPSAEDKVIAQAKPEPSATVKQALKVSSAGVAEEQKSLPLDASAQVVMKRGSDGSRDHSKVFQVAITTEMNLFQEELMELREKVKKLNVEVGTSEEKKLLRQKTDAMEAFCKDLKETTAAQNTEVCTLKREQMEAFSWVEDAKSRNDQMSNPLYLQLTQAQELDPVSARYLTNIKHLVYYVDNQLRQVNDTLDLQWSEFEASCKEKMKGKMHVPSLEAVYQSMVIQSNIMEKLHTDLNNIVNRVAKSKHSRSSRSAFLKRLELSRTPDRSRGESELSQLAENLLQNKLGSPGVNSAEHISRQLVSSLRSQAIASTKLMTPQKVSKLRQMLSEHCVRTVRTVKPGQERSKLLSEKMKALVLMADASAAAPKDPSSDAGAVAPPSGTPAGFAFGQAPVPEQTGALATAPVEATAVLAVPKPTPKFLDVLGNSPAPPAFKATMTSSVPVCGSSNSIATQGVKNASQFSYVPADSGGLQMASFSFYQMHSALSSSSPTMAATTTTLVFSSIGNQFAKPAVGLSGVSLASKLGAENSAGAPLPSAGAGQNLAKSSPVIFGGSAAQKSMSPALSFGGTVTTTTITTTTPLSAPMKSTFGTAQTKSSTLEIPVSASEPGNCLFMATKPSVPASQAKNLSLPSGVSITRVQPATSSVGSVFRGDAKTTSAKSAFSMEQLGLSITPVEPSSDTKSIPSFSSLSLSVMTTASTNTAASSTFSFSLPSTATLTTACATATPSTAADGKAALTFSSGVSGNTFFGKTICGVSPLEQKLEPASTTAKSFSFTVPATTTNAAPAASLPSAEAADSAGATTKGSGITSFFGTLATTSSPAASYSSLFSVPSTTKLTSLFGGTASTFGMPATTSAAVTTTSIFGTSATSAGTQPSIFGSTSVPAATTSLSLFGALTTTATANAVSTTVTPSLFSATTTTTTAGSLPLLFGQTTATSTPPATTSATPYMFGSAATATSGTAPALFGAATTTTCGTAPALFGAAATTTSGTAPVLFSAAAATTSGTAPALFGAAATTTSSTAPPLFGAATTTSSTAPALFGAATTTSATTPSLFDTSGTKPSLLFGAAKTTTTSAPLFAAPATTTTASIFGTPPPAATTSFFSGTNTATTTAATLFSSASVFGGSPATSTPSIFGSTVTSTPSFFSQATTASPMFGQSTSSNIFSQTLSTASTFFGGAPQSEGFGSKPPFGQTRGPLFGDSASSSFGSSGSPIFGSGSSAFGNRSMFQATGGSIFGGASQQPTSTSGGAFSAGMGQSISQSGFGSPPAFQSKPGIFGGAPVFNQSGSSSFGSPPTFGGQAVFGSSPTFGNTGTFGSTSPTQQSSTFESLASQNTMTFGNLASSQNTTNFGFGGDNRPGTTSSQPAFPSTPSFGGSSFSSWR